MIDFEASKILILGAALIVGFIVALFLFRKKERYPYYACDTLLSAAELKFYGVLRAVTHYKYDISCKVRLADIIQCTEYDWHRGYGPKISSKHIDFVLYDPKSSKIILCIELDDSSHALPNRVKRDKFVEGALKSAGVNLLRVPVARGYDMARIEKEIVLATQ